MCSQENTESEVARAAYAEVCRSYERIDDFRAKLLGFLPLASGTGLFLLVGKDGANVRFVAGLGLPFYELRGIQRCISVATVGAALEYQMGIEARFRRWPNSVGRFINEPIAAAFIYSGLLASWAFLVISHASLAAAIISSGSTFFIAFFAAWRFYWYTTKKESDEKAAHLTPKVR